MSFFEIEVNPIVLPLVLRYISRTYLSNLKRKTFQLSIKIKQYKIVLNKIYL